MSNPEQGQLFSAEMFAKFLGKRRAEDEDFEKRVKKAWHLEVSEGEKRREEGRPFVEDIKEVQADIQRYIGMISSKASTDEARYFAIFSRIRGTLLAEMSLLPEAEITELFGPQSERSWRRFSGRRMSPVVEDNCAPPRKKAQNDTTETSDPSKSGETDYSNSFFTKVGERVKGRSRMDPQEDNALKAVIKQLEKHKKGEPEIIDHQKCIGWAEEGYAEYILAYFRTAQAMCRNAKDMLEANPEPTIEERKRLVLINEESAEMTLIEELLRKIDTVPF